MQEDEQAVLDCNQKFYDAFDTGNVAVMDALWSQETNVTCVHPGWAPLRGRDAVMRSWRAILRGAARPRVKIDAARVTVLTGFAFVVCYEQLVVPGGGNGGTMVATNVFAREGESWRLVHHHAGQRAPDAPGGDTDEPAERKPASSPARGKKVLN